jgi:hypothetical protein
VSVPTKEITITHTDLATLDFALSFFDDEEGLEPTDLTGVVVESHLYDKIRRAKIAEFIVTTAAINKRYFRLDLAPEDVIKLKNTLVFDIRLNYPNRVDFPLRVFVDCEKGYTGFEDVPVTP